MTDSTKSPRWLNGVAAILLLAVVVTVAWSIATASPPGSTRATTTPAATVQYRMAQVKTATPLPTATSKAAATARVTSIPSPTLVPTLPAPPTSSVSTSLSQVPRISPEAARAQVEAGTAVFVDVRTEASYKQGHLPGAILLGGGASNSGYSELPDDRLLIFYCA